MVRFKLLKPLLEKAYEILERNYGNLSLCLHPVANSGVGMDTTNRTGITGQHLGLLCNLTFMTLTKYLVESSSEREVLS